MTLSKNDIWAVADQLDAEGKAPTLAAVRNTLGRGSYTTISEAMREWHQRRKEDADKMQAAGPVPPELDETVRHLAQEVWSKATMIAKLEVMRLTRDYAEAKKEWDRERHELESVADDMSSALEECRAKAEEDRAAFSDLVSRHAETEAHVIALVEKARESDARIEELRQENQRLHELLRQAVASGRTESGRDSGAA